MIADILVVRIGVMNLNELNIQGLSTSQRNGSGMIHDFRDDQTSLAAVRTQRFSLKGQTANRSARYHREISELRRRGLIGPAACDGHSNKQIARQVGISNRA